MSRNKTSRLGIWLCVLGLIVCLGIGQLQSQSPTDVIKQHEGLDIAYVDIRQGFSVSPPLGSAVWGGAAAGQGEFKEYLGLSDWSSLEGGESKALVQFRQGAGDYVLTVARLVGKDHPGREEMMQGRAEYWKGKAAGEKVTQGQKKYMIR